MVDDGAEMCAVEMGESWGEKKPPCERFLVRLSIQLDEGAGSKGRYDSSALCSPCGLRISGAGRVGARCRFRSSRVGMG